MYLIWMKQDFSSDRAKIKHFLKEESKMTKISVCRIPHLRNHTWYDCHFWYTRVKWWYLHLFFSFFQNFDFLGCCGWGEGRGIKGQKMVQNHKRFCLLCSISQEPYILWFYLWCIHMCKMTMSPCVFLNFPGC